ncbi:unnamed protein product [Debaryomyces tyrocola]|nr:unnamed protein product [Debaryomyces tyrocola]
MPLPPLNTYPSGAKLTVGSHDISIIKYLSEGGFAHVYTCHIDPPFRGSNIACLKRVAVPNKLQLNLLRQEVDAMKRLKGNTHIVSYIDSHASRLGNPGGGHSTTQQYEVFVLMEYCSKNGLIDFMNTRLTHKLTEPEILTIMHDITIGVAMCHHLKPPLLHRDIKIENVLIDSKGVYKLCDFGSAVGYLPVPKNAKEFSELHEDLMQHTTPQYRAPEMIDLSRGFPIDDKLDIWALGCFLYKLCYYTTPFELPSHSSLQDMEKLILNCSNTLKLPHNQPGLMFSSRLKNVIKCCLRDDPRRRPNAVQLLEEICLMKGIKKVPDVTPYTLKEHHGHNKVHPHVINNTKHRSYDTEEKAPILPERRDPSPANLSVGPNKISAKPVDPFATIDKSKVLQHSASTSNKISDKKTIHRPMSTLMPTYTATNAKSKPKPRPLSYYIEDDLKGRQYRSSSPLQTTSSTTSLQDFIKQQINESNDDVSTKRFQDQDQSTLNFLKSKEEETQKGLSLRQNTGGSIKLSIRNGLRKISTGGSSNGVHGNYSSENVSQNKRSSISSIKQIFTGNSYKKSSSDEPSDSSESLSRVQSPQDEKAAKKLSIQRRMQMLMKNSNDELLVTKTAHGYGKFTDQDDIAAINDNSTANSLANEKYIETPNRSSASSLLSKARPVPPKVPQSLTSSKITPNLNDRVTKTRDKLSAKDSHKDVHSSKKPPPKPQKPAHLKSPENDTNNHERKLSNASTISIPDVDDLEKEFSKRFPSYV